MAQHAMNGGGGVDVDAVCYAMLSRLNNRMEVIENNMLGCFAQVNGMMSGQDGRMLHIQMQQFIRRMERQEREGV